jgi:ubiquitin carboxyl-terminal hydrolase 4/11/15
VQHFGGLDNGHYTAYGLRQNTWIEFNDELTSEAKNVLNDKNAYILFY